MRPEMFFALELMKGDPRASIDIQFLNNRPYENSLNAAVEMGRMGNYDFLLTFDHDNVPRNNPIDLAFLEKDIVGMPYIGLQNREKGIEFAFLAMDKKENGEYLDHKILKGLQEVDAVASGALLLSKRVLQSGLFFEREWDKGFAIRGIDFYFCDKAKQQGFNVWAHYDYLAEHFKEVGLLSLYG